MKIFIIILFSVVTLQLNAQDRIYGEYYDSFGSRLWINPDSTFKYKWNLDLNSSWTKGTWKIINDTIFFTGTPIYDTIRYVDDNIIVINSVILSQDEKSEIITLNSQLSCPEIGLHLFVNLFQKL